jgi:hypothetical protein
MFAAFLCAIVFVGAELGFTVACSAGGDGVGEEVKIGAVGSDALELAGVVV